MLRVRDWDTHFENNRTRDMKVMSWVPVPVKQDGDGYTELLHDPAGAAHLGAWLAILQVAAKCEPRGTLARDRGDHQVSHDAQSLSRLTRVPVDVMEEAIRRLLAIGWLEQTEPARDCGSDASPHLPAGGPQASRTFLPGRERKGMERNGTERLSCSPQSGERVSDAAAHGELAVGEPDSNGATTSGYASEFEAWWDAYPRKVGKRKAATAFSRARRRASVGVLMEAVTAFAAAWEGGADLQFCPHPETWLNQDRWSDDRTNWGPRAREPSAAKPAKDYSVTHREGQL